MTDLSKLDDTELSFTFRNHVRRLWPSVAEPPRPLNEAYMFSANFLDWHWVGPLLEWLITEHEVAIRYDCPVRADAVWLLWSPPHDGGTYWVIKGEDAIPLPRAVVECACAVLEGME